MIFFLRVTEMDEGDQKRRGSSSCLKRSSVVLGSSSLSVPALDTELTHRDGLEVTPSVEGNYS